MGGYAPVAITKVLVPRRRPGVVERRRLLDLLHRHLDRRLQLVAAPAGYGKTTLLVDFAHEVREAGVPVCWLSLDDGDARARSFFDHLLLSLRQAFPQVGAQAAALLSGVENPAREHHAIAAAICNELAPLVDEHFVLILDDFHTVANSAPVAGAVDRLLQLLPDAARLVLGSRSIPTKLSLSALAARLEVAGLGPADLRFRADEAQTLVDLRARLDPTDPAATLGRDEAGRIVRRAEGWVAAIVLSLQSRDTGGFSALLRAKAQAEPIYDYLATQVFDRLPAALRRFLTESAVLPVLCAEECDALLQRTDSAACLNALLRLGLFTEPLEDATRGAPDPPATPARDWFRYHQLWRDFLLERLRQADPPRLAALRRRAAGLALQRGTAEAAVEHLLGVGDGAEAARLIVRLAERAEQNAMALREWETAFLARAWRAQMLAFLGRGGEAVAIVTTLFERLNRHPRRPALRARLEKEVCMTYGVAGRYREAARHGTAALSLFRHIRERGERLDAAATVCHMLGICHTRLAAPDAAARYLRRAAQLWRALGNATQEARVLNGLGRLEHAAGSPGAGVATYREALRLADGAGQLSTQAIVLNNLARALRDQGQLEPARAAVERALPIARQCEEAWLLGEGLLEAGLIALARGDADEAVNLLESAQHVAADSFPPTLPLAAAVLAAAYVRAGRRGDAARAAAAARNALTPGHPAEESLRAAVALAAVTAATVGTAAAATELRAARRVARNRRLIPTFFAECAQYPETARIALHQRRVPPRAAAALAAAGVPTARHEERAVDDGLPHMSDAPAAAPAARRGRPALRVVPRPDTHQQFEVRLFGTPTLLRDGTAVRAWRTHLARELFCFLATRAGSVARSETLVESLLPDVAYARGLTTIRQAVYHVRRLFAPATPLRTVPGGYRLMLDPPLRCDAVEFERLLAHARTLGRRGATPGSDRELIATLEDAVTLYAGPLLEGIEAQWALVARAGAERQFLAAARVLLAAYAGTDQHDAAVGLALRVLAIDPFLEEFHLALLRHQGALGRVAAVRRHYDDYARVMHDELGREPLPEAARLLAAATCTSRAG